MKTWKVEGIVQFVVLFIPRYRRQRKYSPVVIVIGHVCNILVITAIVISNYRNKRYYLWHRPINDQAARYIFKPGLPLIFPVPSSHHVTGKNHEVRFFLGSPIRNFSSGFWEERTLYFFSSGELSRITAKDKSNLLIQADGFELELLAPTVFTTADKIVRSAWLETGELNIVIPVFPGTRFCLYLMLYARGFKGIGPERVSYFTVLSAELSVHQLMVIVLYTSVVDQVR